MLQDAARQKLCDMIREYGPSVCQDPRRVEGLLRDLCAEYRLECKVLVSALEEQVPSELLAASGLSEQFVADRLVGRLQEDMAMTEEAARWAVTSWAMALGKLPPTPAARGAIPGPSLGPFGTLTAPHDAPAGGATLGDRGPAPGPLATPPPAVPPAPLPQPGAAPPPFPPAAPAAPASTRPGGSEPPQRYAGSPNWNTPMGQGTLVQRQPAPGPAYPYAGGPQPTAPYAAAPQPTGPYAGGPQATSPYAGGPQPTGPYGAPPQGSYGAGQPQDPRWQRAMMPQAMPGVPMAYGVNGPVPPEVACMKWNWGAFSLPAFWLINHNMVGWGIGLLAATIFIPGLGWFAAFICGIVLGLQGNEMAWLKRPFQSIDQFRQVETAWNRWGIGMFITSVLFWTIVMIAASQS